MPISFDVLLVADGVENFQAAAALRQLHGRRFATCFLPGTSTKLDLSGLDSESRVVLLGVTEVLISENDRDDWQISLQNFVGRIQNAGHQITGILESWGANYWRSVLTEPSFSALAYKPENCEQDSERYMANYFPRATETADNDAIRKLFLFGAEDSFTVGEIFYDVLQSSPEKERPIRANYLIEYYGSSKSLNGPDQRIKQWKQEALQQRQEYEVILAMRVKLGNDFWSISKDTKWTSRILSNLAGAVHQGERAVVVHFDETTETGRQVSFSMHIDRAGELIALLDKEGLNVIQEPPYRAGTRGYVRIIVQPKDENRAIEIIKDALSPK